MALRDGRTPGRMMNAGSLEGGQRQDSRTVPAQLERKSRHYQRHPLRIGAPPIVVTACTPNKGSMAGGYPVVITGDYFDMTGQPYVSPQGVDAPANTARDSEQQITCPTWSSSYWHGATDLFIYNERLTDASSLGYAFRFQPLEQEEASLFFRGENYGRITDATWESSEPAYPETDLPFTAISSPNPPTESSGAPTFTGKRGLTSADSRAQFGNALGTGAHHVFAVVDLTAVAADTGTYATNACIFTDAGGYCGLSVRRTGSSGAYHYWVDFFEFSGSMKVATVEVTADLSSSGVGRICIQAKKDSGVLYIRRNAAAWVTGNACGATTGSASTQPIIFGENSTGTAVLSGTIREIGLYPVVKADSTWSDLMYTQSEHDFPSSVVKVFDYDSRFGTTLSIVGADTLVTAWADQSGNGLHLTAPAGQEPHYNPGRSEYGGQPSIDFPSAPATAMLLQNTTDLTSIVGTRVGTGRYGADAPVTILLVGHVEEPGVATNSYFIMSGYPGYPTGFFAQQLQGWAPYSGAGAPTIKYSNPLARPGMIACAFAGGPSESRFYDSSIVKSKDNLGRAHRQDVNVYQTDFRYGINIGNWMLADAIYVPRGPIVRAIMYKGTLSSDQIAAEFASLGALYNKTIGTKAGKNRVAQFDAGHYSDAYVDFGGRTVGDWEGSSTTGGRTAALSIHPYDDNATETPAASTINGLSVPYFDGINDLNIVRARGFYQTPLTIEELFGATEGTMIFAVIPDTPAGTFSVGSNASWSPFLGPCLVSDTAQWYMCLSYGDEGSGTPKFFAGIYDGVPRDLGGGPNTGWQMAQAAATAASPHVAVMRWDSTHLELSVDAPGGTITWNSVDCGAIAYRLGYAMIASQGTVSFPGKMGSVRFFNKKLSDAEIQLEGVDIQNLLGWSLGYVSAVAQNITGAGSIASAEAFGTLKINFQLKTAGNIASAESVSSPKLNLNVSAPTSIATAEAFGTPKINENVSVAGNIATAEAFGTAKLNENVGPAGNIATAEAVSNPTVSPGAVSVSPSSITTAEAFGSPKLNMNVSAPTSIASAEAVSSPQLNENVQSAGNVASSEAFGSPTLNENVTGAGNVGSAEAVSNPTVSAGASSVTGAGDVATAEAFGTPKINENVGPHTSITSAEAFGTPKLNENITSPTSIVSAEAFGSPTLNENIAGAGNVASAEAVAQPTVSPGSVTVSPSSVASAEAFGTAAVGSGIAGVGDVPSGEAFGTPQLNENVTGAGNVASGEGFGTPAIGTLVAPSGIATAEAFGSPQINENIGPHTSIPSAEAVSAPQVSPGAVTVTPSSIASAEAVLAPGLALNVAPAGIASQEAVSAPGVAPGAVTLTPTGIASGEAFGAPVLGLRLFPVAIPSAEAFGAPIVAPGSVAVSGAGGIPSEEALGAPDVNAFTSIVPSSIPSAEAFGLAQLDLNIIDVGGIESVELVATPTIIPGIVTILGAGDIASEELVEIPEGVFSSLQIISHAGNIPSAVIVNAPTLYRVPLLLATPVDPSEGIVRGPVTAGGEPP